MLLSAALITPEAFASQRSAAHPSWNSHPIYFGADYYPEDYPLDQVERDAAAMEKAGFNVVRMLDTNWAAIEPHDGQFSFSWLDHVLAILARHHIQAILGVPSYVPPYWLLRAHPDILLINQEGVRYRPGGMGGVDLLDPVYLQYVHGMDKALARHYGSDPRVVGWQIDNELGIWGSACYNPACLAGFHAYLRHKFGTIAELNRRWATVSYGHQFTSFDEVPLDWQPVAEGHQSSLEFEVKRFFTAVQVEFVHRQAEIFRRFAPGQFVTHNAPGPNLGCDYARLAQPLDFISFDNYPGMGNHRQAMLLDLARGYNHGATYLILEEIAGAPGPYIFSGPQPPPGQLRLWAYETIAHGADGVLFFRWRTARSGSEEFWQGLLDPAGESTRRLSEISRMGSEIRRIAPVLRSSRPTSRIGLVFSWDSWAAMNVGDANWPYPEHIADWHQALARAGLNIDVISPSDDFSRYALLIAPDLYLLNENLEQRLEDFVRNGGTLVWGPRAATKDNDNRFFLNSPGPVERLSGTVVAETTLLSGKTTPASPDYVSSPNNHISSVSPDWRGSFPASEWAEVLQPRGARVLFTYTDDFYAARPAVTLNSLGRGQVFYLGSEFDAQFKSMLIERLVREVGIKPAASVPAGLEVLMRQGTSGSFLFLLNFAPEPKNADLAGTWQDAFTGETVHGNVSVPGLDVRILESRASP